MHLRSWFGLLAAIVFCSTGAADTIDTFTFTVNAISDISGSITFGVDAQGVAQLPDVIGADVHASGIMFILQTPPGARTPVEIPASAYSVGDMFQFMFHSEGPGGCQNPGNFPPGEVCYFLSAGFNNPAKPFIFFDVEFDPKTSQQVGSGATYIPIPNQEGVHGGIASLQISEVIVPESSSFSCFVAVCGALFLAGFRGRFKGAHAPLDLPSILRNQHARRCGRSSRWNRAQIW